MHSTFAFSFQLPFPCKGWRCRKNAWFEKGVGMTLRMTLTRAPLACSACHDVPVLHKALSQIIRFRMNYKLLQLTRTC